MGTNSIVPSNPPSTNPQQFNFNGFPITTRIGDDGEPRFGASELCAVLGIGNVGNAVARLDDDEKDNIRLPDAIGRMRDTVMVTESGMYNLILRSDKPLAKDFKRWITHEVLPTLHKTGSYGVKPMTPAETLLAIVQLAVDNERRIAQLEAERGAIPPALKRRLAPCMPTAPKRVPLSVCLLPSVTISGRCGPSTPQAPMKPNRR